LQREKPAMKVTQKFIIAVVLLALASPVAYVALKATKSYWQPVYFQFTGLKGINEVVSNLGKQVEKRMKPYFKAEGLQYPPQEIAFLAFKQERILEVWVKEKDRWHYLKTYTVLGASGNPGPKLKEGDRQVPEGFYRVIGLNPQGYNYLTLVLDYPNNFDIKQAVKENRENLGGEICIHGGFGSVGCLAVGDEASEDLFVMVALAGMLNTRVLIAPNDLRTKPPVDAGQFKKSWVKGLYADLKKDLSLYPKSPRRF